MLFLNSWRVRYDTTLSFSSYVILAPKIFRPGMKAKINVLILKEQPPGTPIDVEATFLINSIPIASAAGQFRAGMRST